MLDYHRRTERKFEEPKERQYYRPNRSFLTCDVAYAKTVRATTPTTPYSTGIYTLTAHMMIRTHASSPTYFQSKSPPDSINRSNPVTPSDPMTYHFHSLLHTSLSKHYAEVDSGLDAEIEALFIGVGIQLHPQYLPFFHRDHRLVTRHRRSHVYIKRSPRVTGDIFQNDWPIRGTRWIAILTLVRRIDSCRRRDECAFLRTIEQTASCSQLTSVWPRSSEQAKHTA